MFVIAASFWLHDIFHPLIGRGYQFWSGVEGAIPQLAILGAAIAAWRKINCQTPWCWRIGRHPTADGLHHLCRVCHPDLPNHRLSLAEIRILHHKAKDSP